MIIYIIKTLYLFIPQTKWTNKERVLVFSSRGISYRGRHLMNDMRTLMPHAKSGMGVYNANKQTPKCIYVLVLIGMYIEMLHGKFFIALKLIKKIIQHIISNF